MRARTSRRATRAREPAPAPAIPPVRAPRRSRPRAPHGEDQRRDHRQENDGTNGEIHLVPLRRHDLGNIDGQDRTTGNVLHEESAEDTAFSILRRHLAQRDALDTRRRFLHQHLENTCRPFERNAQRKCARRQFVGERELANSRAERREESDRRSSSRDRARGELAVRIDLKGNRGRRNVRCPHRRHAILRDRRDGAVVLEIVDLADRTSCRWRSARRR